VQPEPSKPKVDAYIRGVLSGEVCAGELTRLAVQRHVEDSERWPAKDLEEAKRRDDPFYFDEVAAEFVLGFYRLCRHVEGELAGEPFDPLPWQAFVDWVSFGWMRTVTGARRFSERWIEVCRGNGKSYWMSANGDFMTLADGEPGAKVFAIATKEDQAVVVWGVAAEIIKQSPDLAGGAVVQESVNNRRIFVPEAFTSFRPLPSDPKRADSLNPHAVYLDEIHEWQNRKLYTKMKTAMGKRRQSMITDITTAGDDRSATIYEELHEYAERVLHGASDRSFVDDSFFAVIYAIDKDDDPYDEACWPKGNPSLFARGASVHIEHLRGMANRAKVDPESYRDMLRLHLGRRVSAKAKAISDEQWKVCIARLEDGLVGAALEKRDWSPFDGRPCFSGIDLSSTRDLTALSLYFPPWDEWPFETYRFYAWLPEENLQACCDRDRAPYDQWVREGWLELTSGDEIDDEVVFARALELAERYQVVQWAYDPWHAVSLKNRLQSATGIEMVKFVQDLPSFGEPTILFLDAIAGRKIRHDGNPLDRWCAGNVICKEDGHGNKRPHKGLSNYRIDPIVAAIMARGRAIVTPVVPPGPPPSVYDGRGIEIVG
jgi:phage terminase large subunit-like protein